MDAQLGGTGGLVSLIMGPMFAGKTTRLIQIMRDYALARQRVLIVRPATDARRPGPVLRTHSGLSSGPGPDGSDELPVRTLHLLQELFDELEGLDGLGELAGGPHELAGGPGEPGGPVTVVGVDEGQFFPDLAAGCERLARRGVRVYVAALDSDFRRRAFPAVRALLPLCDFVGKLQGVCMRCARRPSAFSRRLARGGGQVLVGGGESYQAVCRQCHAEIEARPQGAQDPPPPPPPPPCADGRSRPPRPASA